MPRRTNEAKTYYEKAVTTLFLKGKSTEEIIQETGYGKRYVGDLVFSLIAQALKRSGSKIETRLEQIREIETKLFESIEESKTKKTAALEKKIKELQGTYCRFLLR